MQSLVAPPPPGTKSIAGRLDGSLNLTPTNAGTTLATNATVTNLLVTSPSGSTWREPTLGTGATVRFDPNDKAVLIDALEVTSQALAVVATGRVDRPDADCFVDVEGTLKYDWATLQPALAAYFPREVQIVGNESRPFSIKGPLGRSAVIAASTTPVSMNAAGQPMVGPAGDPAAQGALGALVARTSVGWQEAAVLGFHMQRAELPLTYEDGTLRLARSQVVTNGGEVTLDGAMRLSPSPRTLFIPAGRVIDHVEVTPEMCSQALMYVSPIFAGVTEASGQFSVDFKDFDLPVDDPQQGRLSGEFTIHTIQLGPGPLMRELGVFFPNLGDIRLKKESAVPFEMYQGRIYHRDLVLQFSDFEIHMTGSVGLDGTLSMTAIMPIPAKWIGNNVLGDFLKNRTIEVPIGGTVERPQIDQARLDQLMASIFRESATGSLQNEIGRQLNRLFGPPQ
ncbi:MAG: hypothetical protein R3C10_03550 [Pirellulales bacterium]